MLVLTRKPNESIVIGDNIEITILEVRGDQVKVGVSAPTQIPVHRLEIYQEIRAENRLAESAPLSRIAALRSMLKKNR